MASVTPDQALANGWIITNDGAGNTVYLDAMGNVIDPGSSGTVANIGRTSAAGSSAGFDFWTAATDLLNKGVSIYEINQQQKTIQQQNQIRAAQGLPPLSLTGTTPSALDPKLLLIGGAVLVAVLLLGRRR